MLFTRFEQLYPVTIRVLNVRPLGAFDLTLTQNDWVSLLLQVLERLIQVFHSEGQVVQLLSLLIRARHGAVLGVSVELEDLLGTFALEYRDLSFRFGNLAATQEGHSEDLVVE